MEASPVNWEKDGPKDQAASEALSAMQARLRSIQELPPDERAVREAELGPDLEDLVKTAKGTRIEKRAWYLLAQWRFQWHDDGAGVQEAIVAFNQANGPGLGLMIRSLQIQLLLRQGRLVAARQQAVALIEETSNEARQEPAPTPQDKNNRAVLWVNGEKSEFSPLMDLVTWHESVGKPAQTLQGRRLDLDGGLPLVDAAHLLPLTDLADVKEPWILVARVPTINAESAYRIRLLRESLAAVPVPVRLVVAAEDASPALVRLHAAALLGSTTGAAPGKPTITVLFPTDLAQAEQWRREWPCPANPTTVLMDVQRKITAVGLRPSELATRVR